MWPEEWGHPLRWLARSLYWLFLEAGLAHVREHRPRDQRNSGLKMLGGLKYLMKLEVCVWKLSKSQSGLNIFWLIDMEKYLWRYSFFSKKYSLDNFMQSKYGKMLNCKDIYICAVTCQLFAPEKCICFVESLKKPWKIKCWNSPM